MLGYVFDEEDYCWHVTSMPLLTFMLFVNYWSILISVKLPKSCQQLLFLYKKWPFVGLEVYGGI